MFEIGRIHFLMNPGQKRHLANAIYLEHIALQDTDKFIYL
jgi:hypothetical protein